MHVALYVAVPDTPAARALAHTCDVNVSVSMAMLTVLALAASMSMDIGQSQSHYSYDRARATAAALAAAAQRVSSNHVVFRVVFIANYVGTAAADVSTMSVGRRRRHDRRRASHAAAGRATAEKDGGDGDRFCPQHHRAVNASVFLVDRAVGCWDEVWSVVPAIIREGFTLSKTH